MTAPIPPPLTSTSLSEANLTVLYRNLTFTTFTDLFEIRQKMESYIIVRMRADPRCRHGWACGGSKPHRTIYKFTVRNFHMLF